MVKDNIIMIVTGNKVQKNVTIPKDCGIERGDYVILKKIDIDFDKMK